MQEDKQRWNERYLDNPMPQSVSPLLEKNISHAKGGQAGVYVGWGWLVGWAVGRLGG